MYFIEEGEVLMLHPNGSRGHHLGPGAFFGEVRKRQWLRSQLLWFCAHINQAQPLPRAQICMIDHRARRTMTARAVTAVFVHSLARNDFVSVRTCLLVLADP